MKNIFKWRNFFQSNFFVKTVMKLDPNIRKLRKNSSDFPQIIQIMTNTGCNYKCDFCPNKDIHHSYKKMTIELFCKILNDIPEDWEGFLMLFSQNEPLLDERLPELLKLTKTKLVRCKIEIQTNGSLLNKNLIEQVLPYVDILKVNDYSNNFKVINKIEKYNLKDKKLVLVKRYPKQEILSNRAGNVTYKKIKKLKLPLRTFCIIPFEVFYIIPDGRVILCCNDWKHEQIMGDLNTQSIREIWKNHNFELVRKSLNKRIRDNSLCSKCDYIGFSIGDLRRKYYKLYKFLEGYI
jgi:radical SAM protein with 4Fe4S-binding SPASM domain